MRRSRSAPATLVELPLGASLDRLVGALDLGRALNGEKAFEAGLLARAHQGILYVDEVNLLPDHLVDALLDAAASGVSRVERDAVSAVHDARFLLVGTMNVEEGELRPQLLDRFGLGVEVTGPPEPDVRAEIVRRRLSFERDAEAFAREWQAAEDELAARIAAARTRLPQVRLPERELLRITAACASLGVDGVRGDIVTARAARALAALEGLLEVEEEHVRRAAALALLHRRRRDPLDGRTPSPDDIERALDDEPPPEPPSGGAPPDGGGRADPPPAEGGAQAPSRERRDAPARARLPAEAVRITRHAAAGPAGAARAARARAPGRSTPGPPETRAPTSRSWRRCARASSRATPPACASTCAAAARACCCAWSSTPADRWAHAGAWRASRGRCWSSLREAYERRDRVAVISFRGSDAQRARAARRAARRPPPRPSGSCRPAAARRSRPGSAWPSRSSAARPGASAAGATIAVILTDGRVEDPDRRGARAPRRGSVAPPTPRTSSTSRTGPCASGSPRASPQAAGARRHVLTDPPAMPRTAA